MCLCLLVCVIAKISDKKKVLNGGEYDINWDYDVYSLKFVFILNYYSKPLVIWIEDPSIPIAESIFKVVNILGEARASFIFDFFVP